MSYHFTEEFKGWHVNAKAMLSPQGISTPEFTLHPQGGLLSGRRSALAGEGEREGEREMWGRVGVW